MLAARRVSHPARTSPVTSQFDVAPTPTVNTGTPSQRFVLDERAEGVGVRKRRSQVGLLLDLPWARLVFVRRTIAGARAVGESGKVEFDLLGAAQRGDGCVGLGEFEELGAVDIAVR